MESSQKKPSSQALGGAILLAVVAGIFFWSNLPSDSSSPSPTQAPTYPTIGQQGYIDANTTIGVSKDAYDAVFKALSANDSTGFYQLEASGEAFELKARTKVLVIDSSWGDTEVRFLAGSHSGETGWVGYESVKSN